MAAITTAQDGNSSASSTWTGGVVPGNGDTITLNHVVTFDQPMTVGTSGATGTVAITAVVAPVINAQITLRGDFSINKKLTLSGGAGGGIIFDPPSGSTYKLIVRNAGTAGSGTYNFIGSVGNPFIITTTQGGGGNGYIDIATNSGGYGAIFNFTNVAMSYLGSSSQVLIVETAVACQHTFTNVTINNCGKLTFASTTSTTAAFSLNNVDFRNPASTEIFSAVMTGNRVSGSRNITNTTIYSDTPRTITLQVRDLIISGLYLHNVGITNTGNIHNGSWRGIFLTANDVVSPMVQIQNRINLLISDSVFLARYANQHYLMEDSGVGSLSANVYSNNIFDGDGYFSSDAGDCVFVSSGLATINSNIAINKAGVLVTTNGSGAVVTIDNNTSFYSYPINIGETTGSATHVASIKNNLFVNQPSGVSGDTAFIPQSAMIVNYNGYFGMSQTFDGYVSAESQGVAYMGLSKAIRLSSITLTSGTNTTTVVASGKTFITSGVVAGDWFYNGSLSKAARVLSVDSETQLTLAAPIAGQASGDSACSVRKSYWSTTGKKYGDSDAGINDISIDPDFVDSSRTVRISGGWPDVQAVGREMCTINGVAYDGTSTTATTKTVDSILTYIRDGFRPKNMALATLGESSGKIGAVQPIASGKAAMMGF